MNIKGLPLGMKIVRIATQEEPPRKGEVWLMYDKPHDVIAGCDPSTNAIIVVPDNPYNCYLSDVEKAVNARGYKVAPTDYFRTPKRGEWLWSTSYTAIQATYDWANVASTYRLILQPPTRKILVMPELVVDSNGIVHLPCIGEYSAAALVKAGGKIEERPA